MSEQDIPSPVSGSVEKPYIYHIGVSALTDNDRDRIGRLHTAFDLLERQVSEFEDAVRLVEDCESRRNVLVAEKQAMRDANRYYEDHDARLALFASFRRLSSWQRMASTSAAQSAFDLQVTLKLINSLSFEPISRLEAPSKPLLGAASAALKSAIGDARPVRNATSHAFELHSKPEAHEVTLENGSTMLSSSNLIGSEIQASWKGENYALRVDDDTFRVLAGARNYVFAAFKPTADSSVSLKRAQTGNLPQESSEQP